MERLRRKQLDNRELDQDEGADILEQTGCQYIPLINRSETGRRLRDSDVLASGGGDI